MITESHVVFDDDGNSCKDEEPFRQFLKVRYENQKRNIRIPLAWGERLRKRGG